MLPPLGQEFAIHQTRRSPLRVSPRGDAHSNTVENFFSILKRGVIGTYHHW